VHASATNPFLLETAALQIARGDAQAALATLARVAPPREAAALPLAVDETAGRVLAAQALIALGRDEEARAVAQRALGDVTAAPVRDYYQLLEADAALRLGQALQRLGDAGNARAPLERAVALRAANDDATTSVALAEAQVALADCLLALQDPAGARALVQSASAIDAAHPVLGRHVREPLAQAAAREAAERLRIAARAPSRPMPR
jgi:serine/threonine-protein kinase